jgi:glutaredoxin-related protein
MEVTFSITFREGNVIRVSLSSFTDDDLTALNESLGGVKLVNVSLVREKGNLYTDWSTLSKIVMKLGQILIENPDIILYYYCDEITPIPNIRASRRLQPAEYRNRLFSILFQKGTSMFPDYGFIDTPISIISDQGHAFIHLIGLENQRTKIALICSFLIDFANDLKPSN